MEGTTEDIEGSIICNVKPDLVKNILTLKFGCHYGH